jgi:hypothetical protein
VGRAEFFLGLLERHRLLDGHRWLDVGAGDAWFARQLGRRVAPEAEITCWDANYTHEDLEALRELCPANVTFHAERPTGRFDRILMLDVIEHVEDDAGFVGATVKELLSVEGVVLVSVPAHQSMWSSHDRTLRHHRRYSPDGCRRVLERSGLAVVMSGGLFTSLLPVRVTERVVARVRATPPSWAGLGTWRGGRIVTAVLTRLLVLDGRLSLALSRRGVYIPGLSFWALCRPARV